MYCVYGHVRAIEATDSMMMICGGYAFELSCMHGFT